MATAIRVLFLADSHLGFDLPVKPRVARRRRGHDFMANYAAVLEPAFRREVDLVVHGGDVFDRPGAITSLAYQAFEPLVRIAESGIPVVVVPGNHERSRLPHLRLAQHPNIHVFDRPRTFVREVGGVGGVGGVRVALAGFPYERRDVRGRFGALVAETGWAAQEAEVRLLCVHHCIEGATVGPADYVFRNAPEVIRSREVPVGFAAVLSGHIHRHQVLARDLDGRLLPVPVLYPGSIERTSMAEIGEPKGYLVLAVTPGERARVEWEFRRLPARPMVRREISADGLSAEGLDAAVRAAVLAEARDAVMFVRVVGTLGTGHWRVIGAAHLRSWVPGTMNVEVRPAASRGTLRVAPFQPTVRSGGTRLL
jgi:DNA repair exonuclease SbcCD nuclease subunit